MPETEKKSNFNPSGYLSAFELPEDERLSVMADSIGMDYVHAKESRDETVRYYEQRQTEKFQNRLADEYENKDQDDYYKLMMDDPRGVEWPYKKKQAIWDARRISDPLPDKPEEFGDWGVAHETGKQSLKSQGRLAALMGDRRNEKLIQELANDHKKFREIQKKYSPGHKKFQYDLGGASP